MTPPANVFVAVVFFGVVVLIAVWDVYAVWAWGPHGTVSSAIVDLGRRYPIIPFLTGLVIGHLFWS